MTKVIDNFKDKKENYGQKGNNLKILMELFQNNSNIIVPETLILPISLFKTIIQENKGVDLSDFNNICIDKNLEKQILDSIHKKFENKKLVIRSSATCEDSIFFSGSGQYDSFLNINSDEEIITAIKKVYASLFNRNSNLYSKIYNIDLSKEAMAVLVQAVAPVKKAGVMFSCNPVDKSKKYIIESTKGLGTSVVEGIGNITHLEIDYCNTNTDKEICLLIKAIDKIKEKFGFDVDVEWGIDESNNLYIFQTRPIIFKNIEFNIKYNDSIISQKCIPISKGFTIGKIENITNEVNNGILYQNMKYNFNDLKLLLSCKGVILKENANLSHFSNILRELVKPCVFAPDFKFKSNHLYAIDAFNGNIIDFDALCAKDKINLMFDEFNYMSTILYDSFEKYNGIERIKRDDKYEEVVFDIDEKEVIDLLMKNGFNKTIINQQIYTYDFKDNLLIDNNIIFRIQISNDKVNIQFKFLDMTCEKYRKEKGIIIKFDNLFNAKRFIESYLMVNTGYQERKIVKYVKNDISVNIIKWPKSEPYLGIESKSLEELSEINKKLKLDSCSIKGWGGKQIFEKLNLTIEDCEFDKKEKK